MDLSCNFEYSILYPLKEIEDRLSIQKFNYLRPILLTARRVFDAIGMQVHDNTDSTKQLKRKDLKNKFIANLIIRK